MATFTQTIAANADDGYTIDNGSQWWTNLGLLIAGRQTSSVSNGSYFLFKSVTIANGATISAATLTVVARATQSGTTCTLSVGVSDEDTGTMPTNYATATGKSYAASAANWTAPSMTANSSYVSQDFATSLGSQIARAGWASGNNCLVMLRNNGSSDAAFRDFKDGNAGTTLSVTYTDPATGQPTSRRFGLCQGFSLNEIGRLGGQIMRKLHDLLQPQQPELAV